MCLNQGLWRLLAVRILLPLLLAGTFVSTAGAAIVDQFFDSQQTVVDQSPLARARAIKQGFSDILVKLAGQESILLRPELRVALQNPQRFLQTYTYQEVPNGSLLLTLEFDGAQIEQLFYDLKLPLWDKDRPPVIVWFGVDVHDSGRIILSEASSQMGYGSVFGDALQSRGMPLVWPRMDEQDHMSVALTDLWSLDMTTLVNASYRYSAQIVVAGKVTQTPSGQWLGQWGVHYDGIAHWFEVKAGSFAALAATVSRDLADELGGAYAIEVGHDTIELVDLYVHGVTQLSDYAQVSRVLEGLLLVDYLALKEAQTEALRFLIEIRGGANQFRSSLRTQSRLRAMRPDTTTVSTNPNESEQAPDVESPLSVLHYRWVNEAGASTKRTSGLDY